MCCAVSAGLILALAVVIKLTAALPVGLLLIERFAAAWSARRSIAGRRWAWRAICLAGGLAFGLTLWLVLVPATAIGWQRNLDCLGRWCSLVPTKAVDTGADLFAGDSYSVRNQSLVNSVRHLGNWIAEEVAGGGDSLRPAGPHDPPHAMDSALVNRLLLGARLAVLALAALSAVWAGRRRDPFSSATLFALALVATLVVSPVARTHYFLLVAPAVLLVPWSLHRAGKTRLAWWMAWTPTALVVPQYLWPWAAGRAGWLGIGMTAWLIGGGALLWAAERQGAKGRALSLGGLWSPTPRKPGQHSLLKIDPRAVVCRLLLALLADLIHQKTDGQGRLPRGGRQIAGRASRCGGTEKTFQPRPVDEPMLFAGRFAQLSQKLIELDQGLARLRPS